MSWHYLPELVGGSSAENSSDGERSARSRSTRIAGKCSSDDNGTACSTCSRSGMTFEHSVDDAGVEVWMLFLPASLVSHSASPESEPEKTTRETCGPKQSGSFAKYDPDSASWKMSQASFLPDTSGTFSETWPRVGMMHDGIVFQRLPLAPLIAETDYGSSLPTPSATEYGTNQGGAAGRVGKVRPSLPTMARRNLWPTPPQWATPTSHPRTHSPRKVDHGEQLANQVGGSLNPTWVEWLMGWPLGWTDLRPLEMDKFQEWFKGHGRI